MRSSGRERRARRDEAQYRFRESLFRLPALIVAAGLFTAVALLTIDRALESHDWALPNVLRMRPSAAQEFLAVLAGATITTAGVVFSLTVVSLQLASQQFSPRVLRTFVRDRVAQVVIGLLVATFVYCVVVLWDVRESEPAAPVLATTTSAVLAVVTVLAIIKYLDHLARGLQVSEVLREVAEETAAVLAEVTRESRRDRAHPPVDVDALGPSHDVAAPRDGWVTQSSLDELFRAIPEDGVLRLETRVGAYVSEGQLLARVWPSRAAPATDAAVTDAISIADTRTMQEDFDFGLRQMVDIAVRALSPSMNDATTAIDAVLRLGSVLRRLSLAPDPPLTLSGPDGRVLIRPWDLTYEDHIDHVFSQLRFHGARDPEVAAALLRTLRMLIASVREIGRADRLAVLVEQRDRVLAAVERHDNWLPDEIERLRAIGRAETDPADHG